MKYSNIAIAQRHQEIITTKKWLIYALISSGILHFVILAIAFNFIIAKNWIKPIENPIELVFLETPKPIANQQLTHTKITKNITNQTQIPSSPPQATKNTTITPKSPPPSKNSPQTITNQTNTTITKPPTQQPTPEQITPKIDSENPQLNNQNQQQSQTNPTENKFTPPKVSETLSSSENQLNQDNINLPLPIPSLPSDTQPPISTVECNECIINYPEQALAKKIEGHTELILDINEQGKVTNYSLHKSSGSPELDIPSREQIRRFQFKPLILPKQGFKIRINFAISGTPYHRTLQTRQAKQEQKRLQRIRENKPPENKIEIDVVVNSPPAKIPD